MPARLRFSQVSYPNKSISCLSKEKNKQTKPYLMRARGNGGRSWRRIDGAASPKGFSRGGGSTFKMTSAGAAGAVPPWSKQDIKGAHSQPRFSV